MGVECARHIDTLVLGCTHYPFAAAHLRTLVGPDVQLLDSGDAVARHTKRQLEKAGVLLRNPAVAMKGSVKLFSTGQAELLQAAAWHWLELEAASESLSI